MGYEIVIHFTLDTICPWTYIAKTRLDSARQQIKEAHPDVSLKLHIHPYQLFADAPEQGEDKYQWYLKNKYNDSPDLMNKYTTVMTALGKDAGIHFKFCGTIASTLDAHRVIQWAQEKYGEEVAERIVMSLYEQYFEQEAHPSSTATLAAATRAAGIPDADALAVIDDHSEGLMEVKALIREQASNGVDAVPYVTVEGKRRDFTLEGAKEIAEYVKTIEQVIKEMS